MIELSSLTASVTLSPPSQYGTRSKNEDQNLHQGVWLLLFLQDSGRSVIDLGYACQLAILE